MGCLLELLMRKSRNEKVSFIRLEKKISVSSDTRNKTNTSTNRNNPQNKNQISSEI